jgi:hypothetical protein
MAGWISGRYRRLGWTFQTTVAEAADHLEAGRPHG